MDDPVEVHKFASMLPAFEFQVRRVISIDDAVRGELEVMAWRDNLRVEMTLRLDPKVRVPG